MNSARNILRRTAPLLAAVALFFVVAAWYFAPQFAGEVLPQHDVQQYRGMTADIEACRNASGEDPQWTGGMFGGMPAYLINVAYPAQLVKQSVGRVVKIVDTPAAFLFFAMLSMWLMLLVAGVNAWVAIVPALAYGLSTYFLLIIGAGHITKMWALVYAPLMMGGIYCTMRRNMWAGGALTAVAASLEIGANHPQITYYFLLTAAIFWLTEAVAAVRGGRAADFAKRTAVAAAAGLLAVGSNLAPLWYTAQHTPETVRGGSELAVSGEGAKAGDGLDLDYATAWSYGVGESWNLLIPDFMGGDSARAMARDGETAAALSKYGLEGLATQLPMYWGGQPYTAGPTYLGAAAIFLAVLGLFLCGRRTRVWILTASLLMLALSWGRNMLWFTELAFKILPGYDKFRTVSMTLVVVQWTVPLLGAIALSKLWQGEAERPQILRATAWSAGITGGVCLIFALFGRMIFGFGEEETGQMLTGQFLDMLQRSGATDYIAQGLHEDLGWSTAAAMASERAAAMQADAWRSLLFILAAAAAVAAAAAGKLKRGAMVALLAVTVAADLATVDLRYLSHERFVPARSQQVVPTEADRQIMADTEAGFRVLNLTVSPYNDATTSMFHRSAGGYHGAKLSRYQDIIDRYINERALRAGAASAEPVLDMLNTRYVIVAQDRAVRRETALGAAWMVRDAVRTATPQEEIGMLDVVDLSRVAVVDDKFGIDGTEFSKGTIELTEYRPNYLRYEYEADGPALAVFSEIYYDKGWKAYVDGKEAPYIRADYILRAMELPAGRHTVEWRFRAPAWRTAEGITLVCSLAVLAAGAAAVAVFILRAVNRRKEENADGTDGTDGTAEGAGARREL